MSALRGFGRSGGAGTPGLPQVPALEGVDVFAYGASWTASDLESTGPDTRWINRLERRLGFGSLTNRAVNGYRTADLAGLAIGTSASSWVVGTKGAVLVTDGLTNDLLFADDQLTRDSSREALRALLAVLSADQRIDQTTFTFSAGGAAAWANIALAAATNSGGSSALGASGAMTATVPLAQLVAGREYWFLGAGTDGSAATRGQLLTFSQGGTQRAQVDTDSKGRATGNLFTGNTTPLVCDLGALTAVDLLITCSIVGGRSGSPHYASVDALLRKSLTPPTIFVAKPMLPLGATHNKPALLADLRDIVDEVAAEFGDHVQVVDVNPGWAAAAMTGDDTLHLTDYGQAHFAERWQRDLARTAAFRVGLNA